MVEGGPIDVLTGDWLAELTMLILERRRQSRGPGFGFAATFVEQMEQVLVPCLENDIKVVSNAGGLDPEGLGTQLTELASQLGVAPKIAVVTGDDLMLRLQQLRDLGESFVNLDTGEPLSVNTQDVITANAYVGAGGIAAALAAGADIVVTGRVTDASLVVGPAAWWFDWTSADVDCLAGATVAGHLIECGAQVTGGNYAFFADVPGMHRLGFPIAEVESDGSCVVTKHADHGGQVTAGTVTAQLLYEVDSPRYLGPDLVTRIDAVAVHDEGHDRVRITGARGEIAPKSLKVAMNLAAGFRNSATFILTGLDLEAKAQIVERQLFEAIPGGKSGFDDVQTQLLPHRPGGEPDNVWEAQAELRISVVSREQVRVDRAFTSAAVGLTLASVPGLFLPGIPTKATPLSVYWPTTVDRSKVAMQVELAEAEQSTPVEARNLSVVSAPELTFPVRPFVVESLRDAPTVRAPLGRVAGARSGDKGGSINIGLWIRHDLPERARAYAWLKDELSVERFQTLLPESQHLSVRRFEFDNLLAVNFVVSALLGRGVSGTTFVDPQGKGIGEYVRARLVDVPLTLLGTE